MQRGVFIPPFGELADPRLLADLAARAERAGWDGVFLWDHVQYRPPASTVLDPWVAMAAMGAATSRVRLGAMVTPLARRRPWIVARQLAALDILTGGRMVLGVGLGLDDSGKELSTFGEELDPAKRAAMLDEALDVVRGLLSGQTVHHHGAHYVVDGATFLPRPVQSPLPTWVAVRWPNRRPLRRAARYEGMFVIDTESPADLAQLVSEVTDMVPLAKKFDVVVAPEPANAHLPWAENGATWLLTPFSQFESSAAEVGRVVGAGPAV